VSLHASEPLCAPAGYDTTVCVDVDLDRQVEIDIDIDTDIYIFISGLSREGGRVGYPTPGERG